MISWACVLLLPTLLSTFVTASGLQLSQSVAYHHKQLKDVRRLQAGYWLKVRHQAWYAHMMGLLPYRQVLCSYWYQVYALETGSRGQHSGVRVCSVEQLQVATKAAASPAQDAACLKDYGQQYLDRWRRLQGSYCNSTADASTGSHVQCYAHPEADISTCFARDLVLSSTNSFIGNSPHSSELPQPQPGSIHLSCNRTQDPATFLRGRLQSNEGSRAWLATAPAFGVPSSQQQDSCSGPQAVAHPVLLLLRVDPQNAFHNLETVVSVFSALAVLQLEPRHLTHGIEVC
jgi:hypothetical protein